MTEVSEVLLENSCSASDVACEVRNKVRMTVAGRLGKSLKGMVVVIGQSRWIELSGRAKMCPDGLKCERPLPVCGSH